MNIREKCRQLPQGVKASIAFFLSNVITAGISYITTPIYTRLLLPEEYGQVSVFMTWLQILGIPAMFCLSYGVFNIGMLDYPDTRDEYSFSMLILSNLITVCFFALFLCLYPLIKPWVGLDWPLILMMGLIFFFQPAYSFWTARQRYELRYKMTVLWAVTASLLSPLVAVICILIFDNNRLYARIFGAECILAGIYAGFYLYLAWKSRWHVTTKYWKAALLFNLPLIPHYLSVHLLGSSDRLMISHMVGNTATAFYSVAYSVASVASIVWSAINSSLIPYTYENCKKKNYSAISKVTIPLMTVFAACCILVIMFAPEVITIMATAEYKEAIYVIPPVVGGVFFQVQYFIYANVVYYYKKPKYVMYASVSAAILNVVLNWIFIPRFGFIAAGYTTLACYLLQAGMDYAALKKVVHEPVYNMRQIGTLSFLVLAVSLISNLIYDHALLRYSVIALLLLIAVMFRKNLRSVIKELK